VARVGNYQTAALQRGVAAFPPAVGSRALTEAGVFNKVGILAGIAVLAGAIGWHVARPGVVLVAVLCAFVAGLVGTYRPRTAHVAAPLYAALEGLALGSISQAYESYRHGVVPFVVIAVAIAFVLVYAVNRTGLVRVGRSFAVGLSAFGLGLVALMLLSWVIPALSFGGMGGYILFGPVALAWGLFALLADFSRVKQMAIAGMPAEAEWFGALTIMLALVLIYLSLLRMLGGGVGNRR